MDTKVQAKVSSKKKNISEYIVDETAIKAGSEYIWLWIAVEPKDKEILAIRISKERNMFVAEIPFECSRKIWPLSCFNRWRYLVSASL